MATASAAGRRLPHRILTVFIVRRPSKRIAPRPPALMDAAIVAILLDQDGVHIVGIDDLYVRDFVSQGLSKNRYVNLAPVLEQFYIQKVFVPVPAPVPGNHAAAVFTADRDAGGTILVPSECLARKVKREYTEEEKLSKQEGR